MSCGYCCNYYLSTELLEFWANFSLIIPWYCDLFSSGFSSIIYGIAPLLPKVLFTIFFYPIIELGAYLKMLVSFFLIPR